MNFDLKLKLNRYFKSKFEYGKAKCGVIDASVNHS